MRTNRQRGDTDVRTLKTRRGIRIVQYGTVLSEVLACPGPTHSVADVLAAAVRRFSNGPRVALLGFEGGGLLAPLRATGATHKIEAVDISDRSVSIFETHCRSWCGDVEFHLADAETWLRKSKERFDVVIEDISVSSNGDVIQPDFVYSTLPALMRRRLRKGGLAVFNLLPPETGSWKSVISRVAHLFASVHMVVLEEYENRILLASGRPTSARIVSVQLRAELKRIGSRLVGRISVRNVPGIH